MNGGETACLCRCVYHSLSCSIQQWEGCKVTIQSLVMLLMFFNQASSPGIEIGSCQRHEHLEGHVFGSCRR